MSVADFCKETQAMVLEQMRRLREVDVNDEEAVNRQVSVSRQICDCASVGNATCITTLRLVELQSKISPVGSGGGTNKLLEEAK